MKLPAFDQAKSGALLLGIGVLAFVAWRAYKAAPEAIKAVSEGDRVTAYEGAGIVGTAGAAANAVSGGHLSSWV